MWSAGSSASSCTSRSGDAITTAPDRTIRRDFRDAAAVGRRARLELEFEVRGGRTIIAHAYAEPPYRVRAFDMAGTAYVIVVCSGPGVFPGDSLEQVVHVGRGARAVLTSQAALQVHPGNGPPATIGHEYRVAPEGELHCHWDPMIPFTAASVSQRLCIDADAGARLYWSDAMMAGRLGRGEAWRFAEVAHDLQLRIGGELKYLERFRLDPRRHPLAAPWVAGGAGYFSTTLVKHPDARADTAGAFHRDLQEMSSGLAAVDALEDGLIAARVAASNGAVFAAVRRSLRHAIAESLFHQPDLLARK